MTELVQNQAAGQLAKVEPDPEVVERLRDAIESLESFENISFPVISFRDDGFTVNPDEGAVTEFIGVMLFTKESNIYFKDRYKPGSNTPPTCFSPDGRRPNVQNPMHHECKTCKLNQFGSSPTGDGKACRNTRPVFFLVGDGVIPRVLRVPPTSLANVKKYVLNVATDYGSYYGVKTKVSIFKKSEEQTYNNIRFTVAGKMTPEEKANAKFMRSGWMEKMAAVNAGMDEEAEHTASAPQAPEPEVNDENRMF